MKHHGLQTCFLTFRTRGTWLHRDPRGSQDRYRNIYRTPLFPPTPAGQQEEAARLRHPPLTLDARMRRVVHEAIVDKCAWRGWSLHALKVRTAYVHAVLSCHISPDDTLEEIKGRCTRMLRAAGLIAPDRRPWSHHGSTVHIYRQNQYEAVCRYVRDEQGPDLLSLEETETRSGE